MSGTYTDSNVSRQPQGSYCAPGSFDINCHSSAMFLPCRGNITPSIVQQVEKELEFYERVSMVFLLYDNVDIALQFLKAAESADCNGLHHSRDLLFDWAQTQPDRAPYWETTFLEALCIIQNFEIVEKLGYQINDVNERFLPCNAEISLNVDLMRKALYMMCEKLTQEQSKMLINLVTLDIGSEFPSLSNQEEPAFLEMHILFWLSQKHITIQNQSVDLSNLTKQLKKLNQLRLVDYLDSIAKRYATQIDNYAHDELTESRASSIGHPDHSVVSVEMPQQLAQPTDRYFIDPNNVGYCVIINQHQFYKETDENLSHLLPMEILEARTGTDKDLDSLRKAFENFGFNIKVWDNLTHTDILKFVDFSLNELVQRSHSCFVLCILSHGKRNAVYGVNSIPVSVDDIEKCMHHNKLLGKPKILIIQSCQGQEQQNAITYSADISTDGPISSKKTTPQISDMLTLWSTIPGYASFRDKSKGSWYIQTLCNYLMNWVGEADLLEIGLAVNRSIQSKSAFFMGEMKSMQPIFSGTLCKKLILPRVPPRVQA